MHSSSTAITHVAWLSFAVANSLGCSFLFSPGDNQLSSDGGDGGGGEADGGGPDSGLSLCTPGSCPSAVIVHTIGSTVVDDFSGPAEWVAARRGNLVTRVVLATDQPGEFEERETVRGIASGCFGTFVSAGAVLRRRVSLDQPSGVCDAGEQLVGMTSTATATVRGYLSEGVIEKGEMRAGVYTSDTTLDFADPSGSAQFDQNHYMWLTATGTNRHLGQVGGGVVLNGGQLMSTQPVVSVSFPYTRIEWLELTGWQGARRGIVVRADDVFLQHLMLHGNGTGPAVYVTDDGGAASPELWLANSLLFDVGFWAVQSAGAQATVHVANTTVYGCQQREATPQNHGCIGAITQPANGPFEVVNTIAVAVATVAGDFHLASGGTFSPASNNASSDGTGPGNNSPTITPADEFTDLANVPPDLRIRPTSLLTTGGQAVAGWPHDISTDLAGEARDDTWGIGAY